jgi:hypothetical protein
MVSVRGVVGLFSFTQHIDLDAHKGFFISILSQMGKRGGVFNVVNFKVKFIHLLPFFMRN